MGACSSDHQATINRNRSAELIILRVVRCHEHALLIPTRRGGIVCVDICNPGIYRREVMLRRAHNNDVSFDCDGSEIVVAVAV